jgi:hypothetical protein
MHSAIQDMLKAYDCRTADDCRRHALNEIAQEIALLGLYRGGFFAKAASTGARPCAFVTVWIAFPKTWIFRF